MNERQQPRPERKRADAVSKNTEPKAARPRVVEIVYEVGYLRCLFIFTLVLFAGTAVVSGLSVAIGQNSPSESAVHTLQTGDVWSFSSRDLNSNLEVVRPVDDVISSPFLREPGVAIQTGDILYFVPGDGQYGELRHTRLDTPLDELVSAQATLAYSISPSGRFAFLQELQEGREVDLIRDLNRELPDYEFDGGVWTSGSLATVATFDEATNDPRFDVYDPISQEIIFQFGRIEQMNFASVANAQISQDRQTILLETTSEEIYQYHPETGEYELIEYGARASLSPDGRYLMYWGTDYVANGVTILDLQSGQYVDFPGILDAEILSNDAIQVNWEFNQPDAQPYQVPFDEFLSQGVVYEE